MKLKSQHNTLFTTKSNEWRTLCTWCHLKYCSHEGKYCVTGIQKPIFHMDLKARLASKPFQIWKPAWEITKVHGREAEPLLALIKNADWFLRDQMIIEIDYDWSFHYVPHLECGYFKINVSACHIGHLSQTTCYFCSYSHVLHSQCVTVWDTPNFLSKYDFCTPLLRCCLLPVSENVWSC